MTPPAQTKWSGVTVAPKVAVGILTDAKILSFDSPLPQGTTQQVGGEVTVDFSRRRAPNRVGELALIYSRGRASDKIDQTDLPVPDNIEELLRFSQKRDSTSHFMLAEWRWPTFAPVYRSAHWAFVNPRFGLGGGAIYFKTNFTEGDNEPFERTALKWVMTGTTQTRLVEWHIGRFSLSMDVGIRMYAGQIFGISGEGGFLRFAYNRIDNGPADGSPPPVR